MNILLKLTLLHCLKKKMYKKRHRFDDQPVPGVFGVLFSFSFSLSLNLLYVSRIKPKISAEKTDQHKLWV